MNVVTLNVFVGIMGISEDIKQERFSSNLNKCIINIIYTNGWLSQRQVEVLKPHGLTTPQFNILRILRGQYPSPATINLLIERMLDKSSNASRIVDKLEDKGLVERRQCSNDRRAVDVLISKKGLEILEQLDQEIKKWENGFTNLTDAECEQLSALLDKLRS